MTDASNVDVAITGAVYKAPEGSTAPTDATSTPAAAFQLLGFVSSDGLSESPDESINKITAWQGAQVVRTVVTEASLSYGFVLIETTGAVLEAFYRGSQITEPSAGNFQMDVGELVPDISAWIFDIIDGTKRRRIWVPRGETTDREEINYQNDDAIGYGFTIEALPDAQFLSGNKARYFSNVPAWSAS